MPKSEPTSMTIVEKPSFDAVREEYRRYERVGLSLSARYMLDGGRECTCTTLNFSPEGIAVLARDHAAEVGEHVIAYISGMGRVEGTIGRQFDRGFVIKLAAAAQGQFARKIAAAMRRPQPGARADRSRSEADQPGRPTAPMTPEEFEHLTAVIRGLLERSSV
jgi:hypothetical protein